MQKSDFSDVRRAPKRREAVFVPEILLVRDLKPADEDMRAIVRITENTFRDALTKFANLIDQQTIDSMIALLPGLRHQEDMDFNVLVIATWLKVRFNEGIIDQPRQGAYRTPEILNSEHVNSLIKIIIDQTINPPENAAMNIKLDILTHYQLLPARSASISVI